MDQISTSTKNWSILLWAGALGLIFRPESGELKHFTPFLSGISLMFWIVDGSWKYIQHRMIIRRWKISEFLSGEGLEQAISSERIEEFRILDPLGRQHSAGRSKFLGFIQAMFAYVVWTFYALQIVFTLTIYLLIS